MSRSFAAVLRESREEKPQCRCGHVSEPGREVWEYKNPMGKGVFVDCPSCRGYATVEEVIRDPETGKVIRCEKEEPTLERMVREMLADDQRKGEKGGGARNGKTRKTPPKRGTARVEQDGVLGMPQREKTHTTRLKKKRQAEFYVSLPCFQRINDEQRSWYAIGRRGTVTNLVRAVLTAKNLTALDVVEPQEHGSNRHRFTLSLTVDEIGLLDGKVQDYARNHGISVSRGEVIESLLNSFLFESEK